MKDPRTLRRLPIVIAVISLTVGLSSVALAAGKSNAQDKAPQVGAVPQGAQYVGSETCKGVMSANSKVDF